jgi:hypothetical protein
MKVKQHPRNSSKAIVTFYNRKEHDDFFWRTPAVNRLSWRRYVLGDAASPIHIHPIDYFLRKISGGPPETYPRTETVSQEALSAVAASLLIAMSHSQNPQRRALHEEVLNPILEHFSKMSTETALRVSEAAQRLMALRTPEPGILFDQAALT